MPLGRIMHRQVCCSPPSHRRYNANDSPHTDNAAMIAWAGYLKYRRQNEQSDPFDQLLRPKWSLEDIND